MNVRERIADVLEHIASGMWQTAHRLRPAYTSPLCPDCNYAPDPGPDGDCPECLDRWRQQKADEAMHSTIAGLSNGELDAFLEWDGLR